VDFAARSALAAQRFPVQWVEVFDAFGAALHPDTVVHVWKEKATALPVVTAGYRAVLSDNDVWYLDHLDTPWQRFYDNEPCDNIPDPALQKLILGGEACMWGETVDPSVLLATIWPRAAAVAERLWSAAVASTTSASPAMPDGSPNDIHARLHRFRALLLRRGVGAAPLENARAREAPPGPGSCLDQ
jgi:hexosaminidase